MRPLLGLLYFLDPRGYDRIFFDPSCLMDLHDPSYGLGHELHRGARVSVDRVAP